MNGDQENASRLVANPTKMIDVDRIINVLTAYENKNGSCPSDYKENIQDLIKSLHEMEKKANQGKLSVTQDQEEDEEVNVVDEDDDDEDEAAHIIDPTAPDSIIRCNEAADDEIIHCTVCNSQIKQQKSRRNRLSFKAIPKFLKKSFRRPVKKKMKHKNMADVCENLQVIDLQVSSQETKGKKKCSFVQSLKKMREKFNGRRNAESTASNDKRVSVSEPFHSADSPTIEEEWTFQSGGKKTLLRKRCSSRFPVTGKPFGQGKTSIDRRDSVFLIPEGDDGRNEPINKDEQNEKLKLQNQTITPVMEKQTMERIDDVKPQNDQKISPRCRKRCSFSENDLQLLKSIGNIVQFLYNKHSNKFQDDDFGEDDLEFPFERDGSFRHVMSAKQHELRNRFKNVGKHYTQQFLQRVFTEETIIEYGLNRNQLYLGSFENLPDAFVRVETAIPGYKVSKVCENLKEVCLHEVLKYIIDSILED